jgi:copper(I)-binding protein
MSSVLRFLFAILISVGAVAAAAGMPPPVANFDRAPGDIAGSHPHVRQVQMKHDQMKDTPAKTFKVGDILIEAPWLRATPKGAEVAGGYMRITNTGKQPDRLVGGSIDLARRFEVHEMTMVDNVMRMRPLQNGLEIKPGATVELKPGGYHVMAMELTGGYSQGQTVKGTLSFEKAGIVSVEYSVAPIGTQAPQGAKGH